MKGAEDDEMVGANQIIRLGKGTGKDNVCNDVGMRKGAISQSFFFLFFFPFFYEMLEK